MALSRTDWSALFTGATNFPAELYQDSVRIHKVLYWVGMLSLLALTPLCVVLSYMEMTAMIAVINIALILVLGFYATSPAAFIGVFSAGAAAKLGSYNWTWRNIFVDEAFVFPDIQLSEAAKQGWEAYLAALKLPAHILLVAITAGTVLALLRIEHPMYAMVFFPAMVAIGLWTFIHASKAVWYRRITITILVIGALVSFYKAFGGNEVMEGVTYSKTMELEVGTLQPHKLCGVQPGNRKFSIPHKNFIRMDGDDYEVTSYIRVNNTLPDESFEVERSGCVQVSFAFTQRALGRSITPQIVRIAFR